MIVIIKSVKTKPFKNDDGELMDYYWYKAERKSDEVTFTFGSLEGGHNGECDLNIEKTEKNNGRGFVYKENMKGV